jgi:hypothetical protein
VLSHAHIDHSGNIPNLVRRGFRGKIVCTAATADLCGAMLLDSGHIQERDVEYVNKYRRRQGEPPVEPIYTQEDAERSLKHFQGVDYDEPLAGAGDHPDPSRRRPHAGFGHRGPRLAPRATGGPPGAWSSRVIWAGLTCPS